MKNVCRNTNRCIHGCLSSVRPSLDLAVIFFGKSSCSVNYSGATSSTPFCYLVSSAPLSLSARVSSADMCQSYPLWLPSTMTASFLFAFLSLHKRASSSLPFSSSWAIGTFSRQRADRHKRGLAPLTSSEGAMDPVVAAIVFPWASFTSSYCVAPFSTVWPLGRICEPISWAFSSELGSSTKLISRATFFWPVLFLDIGPYRHNPTIAK